MTTYIPGQIDTKYLVGIYSRYQVRYGSYEFSRGRSLLNSAPQLQDHASGPERWATSSVSRFLRHAVYMQCTFLVKDTWPVTPLGCYRERGDAFYI